MFIAKERLLQFNGYVTVFSNAPRILGPLLAPLVLELGGLRAVLLADMGSFLIALSIVSFVLFPELKYPAPKKFSREALMTGVGFIFGNFALRQVLLVFTLENFLAGLATGLTSAFIISRAAGDGVLAGLGGAGVALGAALGGVLVAMAAKRIKKPLAVVFAGFVLAALLGRIGAAFFAGLVIPYVLLFVRNLVIPVVNAACETIWQLHTPKEMQGRVFGARRLFAQGLFPVAVLLGGVLLDFFLPAENGLVGNVSELLALTREGGRLAVFFGALGCFELLVILGAFVVTLRRRSG